MKPLTKEDVEQEHRHSAKNPDGWFEEIINKDKVISAKEWLKEQYITIWSSHNVPECPKCKEKIVVHRYKDHICLHCLIDEAFDIE